MSDVVYNVADANGGVFKLQLNGSSIELLRDGVVIDARPLASVTSYTVNGGDGNETFVIDQLIALPGGVFFNGGLPIGPPGDAIVIQAAADAQTFTYANATDGTIVFTSGGVSSVYNFTGIDPLTNSGALADLVFNLPGNTHTQLEDDGTSGNNTSRLRDTLGGYEQTTFVHPTGSLTINGQSTDDVTVDLTDSLGSANLLVSAGTVSVAAGGVSTSGTVSLSGGTVQIAAGTNLAHLAVNQTQAGASFSYTDPDALTLSGLATSNGAISLATTDGDLTVFTPGISAGTSTVSLTAGGAGRKLTVSAGGAVAGTGGVTLTADKMALLDAINAGTAAVTLQPFTAGTLIDLGSTVDTTAGTLELSNAELKEVTAGTLTIGDGSAGDITVSNAIAPTGTNTLVLETGGAIAEQAVASISIRNLALIAGSSVTLSALGNNVTTLAASLSGAGASLSYAELNSFNVGTVGSITGITTNGGDVTLTAFADLGLGAGISAPGATVTLTSQTSRIFHTGTVVGPHVSAKTLSMTALNGIADQFNPIRTQIETLSAINTGVAGSIDIVEADDVTVTALKQTGTSSEALRLTSTSGSIALDDGAVVGHGLIKLTATAGAVTDADGGTTVSISGGSLTFSTAAGFGSADAIDTAVGSLSGTNSTSGDIRVREANGLDLAGISTQGGNGSIVIETVNGSITTSGTVGADGAGAVTLTANGAGSSLTVSNAVSSTSGSVTLNAAADLTLNAAVATTGAVTLNAAGTTTVAVALNGLGSLTTDAAGTTALNGGSVMTTGAQSYHDTVTLGADTTLTGTAITFDSTVNNGGFGLTVNETGTGQFSGVMSGSGGFTKGGSGTTTLAAANSYLGATTINSGILLVNGSIVSATTVKDTGTLGGHGAVAAVTVESGGTLSPGASAGTLNTGSLSFVSGAHFKVELGGTGAGQSDQVDVTGTVSLAGATLDASLINGFNPETATGATLIIIANDGNDLVTGTFNGLAEGARFAIDGSSFSISYHGGDGNDVVLTVLNDPPAIGGDLAIKVAEGGSVVLTGQDLTATDPDNTDAQLVFTVTGTAHGTVQLNGADTTSFTKADILAGHVSFLHDGGEADGSFSVALSDGTTANITASIVATVDPHVNDAPVAGDVILPSIQVNSGAHIISEAQLLANSTDAEGDTLHVINLHIETGLGALADNHNGTWTYTPKINDDTQVSFGFQVTDGVASSAAHAKLDITSAQSAPAIGTPGDDTFVAVTGNSTYIGGLGVDTISFDFKLTEATVTYSDNQIIIDGPTSHTVLNGIEVFKFTDGTVNNADGSPLVDDLFYYANNHDVWLAGADADAHFANYGWKEGRDPDAFFDIKGYLAHNPDVAAAGINPLTHYDQSGWKEGRDPSAIFDTKGYLAAYPDVKAAGVDPLAHFLLWGAQEGRHAVNDGHWG